MEINFDTALNSGISQNAPVSSIKIFEKEGTNMHFNILHITSQFSLLKIADVKTVNKNVQINAKGFFLGIFQNLRFAQTVAIPSHNPQITNVQLAPCQIPLIRNTTIGVNIPNIFLTVLFFWRIPFMVRGVKI